ncbi:MAG: hypothetical protein IJ419_01610, partial [Agathobacter sp.]|nr:hypothetical protein [Agathobacter sp.]
MVFSFITRTPCIVFSNNNHKVKGTYQWIQDISYIRYVNEVEDVEMIAKELLRSEHDAHDVLDIEDKYKVLIDVLQE